MYCPDFYEEKGEDKGCIENQHEPKNLTILHPTNEKIKYLYFVELQKVTSPIIPSSSSSVNSSSISFKIFCKSES